MERPAASPVKKTAEMGGDWRRNDLCPFPVSYTGNAGYEQGLPHVAGTCGDGLAGQIPRFIVGDGLVRFPLCLLFHLSICGDPLGGKEIEQGILSPKWRFGKGREKGRG